MPTPTEDKFILHCRAQRAEQLALARTLPDSLHVKRLVASLSWVYLAPITALIRAQWEVEKLITDSCRKRGYLTPRGEDLLATADAIGYDPAAKPNPAPKIKPCPDCAGVGRKLLGIAQQGADPEHVCELDYTCPTCEGRREVSGTAFNTISETEAREWIDSVMQVNWVTRRCVEYVPSPGQSLVVSVDPADGTHVTWHARVQQQFENMIKPGSSWSMYLKGAETK